MLFQGGSLLRSGGHEKTLRIGNTLTKKAPRQSTASADPEPTQPERGAAKGIPWNGWLISALRRDSACSRNLNWRFDLAENTDSDVVEVVLEDKGWRVRCRHAALRVFRHGEGHELAWALNTGRVQLRVDLAVPPDHRPDVARSLFHRLGTLLAGCEEYASGEEKTVVA